jgi:hypothetical protein
MAPQHNKKKDRKGSDSDDSGSCPQPKQAKLDAGMDAGAGTAPAASAGAAPQELMTFMTAQFAAVTASLTEQGTKFSSLSQAVTGMQATMVQFQKDTKEEMTKIEGKIKENTDALQRQIDEINAGMARLASSSLTSAAGSGAAASSAPSWPAPAASGSRARSRATPPTPTASRSPDKTHNKNDTKIIVIGFPRALPKAALLSHFERVMKAFVDAGNGNTKPTFYGNAGTMYSIGFGTGRDLGTFMRWYRLNRRLVRWRDPRADPKDDSEEHFKDIIFKSPSSPEERARGKNLAPYHQFLEKFLKDSPKHCDKMLFRTRPDKGTISIETDADLWTPFHIDITDATNTVILNTDVLQVFGFTESQVMAHIKEVTAKGADKDID